MRPVPIPDDIIWEGAERKVFTAPGGDLLDPDIAPVEALVDFPTSPDVPVISVRIALEDGDLVNLAEGGHVWISMYGHLVPFSVDTTGGATAPEVDGPARTSELERELRDAFMEVALAGWKARDMNIGDDRTLHVLAPTMQPMIQDLLRLAVGA